jgi:hypothetical protein
MVLARAADEDRQSMAVGFLQMAMNFSRLVGVSGRYYRNVTPTGDVPFCDVPFSVTELGETWIYLDVLCTTLASLHKGTFRIWVRGDTGSVRGYRVLRIRRTFKFSAAFAWCECKVARLWRSLVPASLSGRYHMGILLNSNEESHPSPSLVGVRPRGADIVVRSTR